MCEWTFSRSNVFGRDFDLFLTQSYLLMSENLSWPNCLYFYGVFVELDSPHPYSFSLYWTHWQIYLIFSKSPKRKQIWNDMMMILFEKDMTVFTVWLNYAYKMYTIIWKFWFGTFVALCHQARIYLIKNVKNSNIVKYSLNFYLTLFQSLMSQDLLEINMLIWCFGDISNYYQF